MGDSLPPPLRRGGVFLPGHRPRWRHDGVVFLKRFTGSIQAVTALLVVLLLLPGISHGLTDEQKGLVGLKGGFVAVEEMDPKPSAWPDTGDKIQADVEVRLRKDGVKVLTQEESSKAPGVAWLYVNVNAVTMPGSSLCAL